MAFGMEQDFVKVSTHACIVAKRKDIKSNKSTIIWIKYHNQIKSNQTEHEEIAFVRPILELKYVN